MFSNLHVFFALIAILYELMALLDTKKVVAFIDQMKEHRNGGKTFEHYSDKQKGFSMMMSLYMLWTLVGLTTVQWPLFIFIIIISSIPKGKSIFVRKVDAFISILTLLFIVVNQYHLHINIYELIKSIM